MACCILSQMSDDGLTTRIGLLVQRLVSEVRNIVSRVVEHTRHQLFGHSRIVCSSPGPASFHPGTVTTECQWKEFHKKKHS